MKKFTFISLFGIFFSCNLMAQKATANEYQYVPIADNHIWSVGYMKFKTLGDTLINNKKYLKVYKQEEDSAYEFDISNAWYFCALRNDTVNKKVYVVYPDSKTVYDYLGETKFLFTTTDTTELLLYDFSLNMGDTVYVYEYREDGSVTRVPLVVVDVFTYWDTGSGNYFHDYDSLKILDNGDVRRQIFLRMPEGTNGFSTAWIEGIGSVHGLTRHFRLDFIPPVFHHWVLLCYKNESELLLSTFWNINNNCFRFPKVGIKENKRDLEFIVYPNPATNLIRIQNAKKIDLNNERIEIFDIYGKRVLRQRYEDEIDISTLKAGYYFIIIAKDGINIKAKGFVKL